MKRDVLIIKGEFDPTSEDVPGDEDAMSRATALGNLVDHKVTERLLQLLLTFELVGGQAYIQARREKYAPNGTRIPADQVDDVDGEWRTTGYVIRYDSRDQRMMETTDRPLKAPDEVELIWPEEGQPVEEPEVAAA